MTQKRTCHFVLPEKPLTTIIQLRNASSSYFAVGKKRRIKRLINETDTRHEPSRSAAPIVCETSREGGSVHRVSRYLGPQMFSFGWMFRGRQFRATMRAFAFRTPC